MGIIVIGSLAYDRVMEIEGTFSGLAARKAHALDVGFHANKIVEKFGGNAGNIAYTLSLLGEKSMILSSVGKDHHKYSKWLVDNHISTEGIRIVEEEMTASAYVIVDREHNQITAFVPGAMEYPSSFDFGKIRVEETLAVVSAGNLTDMKNYCHIFKSIGVPYIFNPGQSLSRWSGEDLTHCIPGAALIVVNEHELGLVASKTGLDRKAWLKLVNAMVITLGEEGSKVCTQDYEMDILAIKLRKVVDPRGAGDAYMGGLAKGLLQGKTLAKSAMMATVCASFSLEYPGTQEFSFSQEEFDDRLDKIKLEMNSR